MNKFVWLALALLSLGGCRIVSQQELAALKTPPDPHLAQLDRAWRDQIAPQIVAQARPVTELLAAFRQANDFDRVCQTLGWRSAAENPCLFYVRIDGVIDRIDRTSRSGKMIVRDRSGQTITVQAGPTLRGMLLRDSYRGVRYADFNDQVRFGEYGRAINNQAVAMIEAAHLQPGATVTIYGVFAAWAAPQTIPLVTPAQITAQGGAS